MLRLTLRTLLARKMRFVMSGLAVVLGVAFLSGVLVFSHGLSATFDNIVKGSTPDAVVRLRSTAGNSGMSAVAKAIDPAAIKQLADLPEVEAADGDVIGLGMNLLAKDGTVVGGTGAPTLAFNYYPSVNMAGTPVMTLTEGHWPTAPDEVVIDEKSQERGDYTVGDTVSLLAPSGQLERKARLVGAAEFNGGGTAGATLLLFSTPGAQQLFMGGHDVFNQVSLTAAPGVTQQQLVDAANSVVPLGFEAVTGDQVAEEAADNFASFLDVIKTFLVVFAIIAVIVGAFIIVNTFSILVAQRSRELALLRALGASRRQVTRSVLVEALLLGLVASTVGLGLGWLLARGLAAAFNSIGLDIASSALTLTGATVVTSYVVGVVVTVLAAWMPARRAGRVAPVAAMRSDAAPERSSLRRRTVIGSVVLLIGAGAAFLGLTGGPGPGALWVGIGAVLWILTLAVLSPIVGRPVLLACRALFARLFGTPGRLAGENALRDPRRTGATASALMIGLALVSTIGVLAASMNKSVSDIIDDEFSADLLVQSTTYFPFSTQVGDRIAAVDGVAEISREQTFFDALLPEHTSVTGHDDVFDEIYHLDVVSGRQQMSGQETVVEQKFADEQHLAVGDALTLGFPAGRQLHLQVVGVIEDSEATSTIAMPLDTLVSAGLVRQDTAISVRFDPGVDAQAVHDRVDDAVRSVPTIGVYDKVEFGEQLRGQVNQLLYMIYGLLALAIVIAVIGIVNTLGLSVIERTREVGLLRAVGMSRRRLRRMITLESVVIALLGSVLGMALGLVIGVLLRETLKGQLSSLGLPVIQLGVFLVIAVVVGVLAAVLPAIRASRMNVLAAIATE